ncbi:MAG: phosphate acyltransferase PlsX [Gemmataceae bacterium]|nr:phosphate acyltransferase PlsX [Gemmataceae bacterium]
MIRVALDAMGGDFAPGPIVLGAVQALQHDPELVLVLVGDQAQVEACLPPETPRDRIEFVHCSEVVTMNDGAVEGLRSKPDNSITRTWQLMVTKKVDAIVSAGNTGAMVAGGLMSRKFLKNVKRPGIATLMPTAKGPCVIIDAGANVFPKPSHLYQYGVMGEIYAKHMLGRENPTIGLINVGEEEGKGHELAQQAYTLLKNGFGAKFLGNIEGRDIHKGAVDVVVTDGFTGNVILKLSQGVFEFVMNTIAAEVIGPLQAEKATAGAAFKNIMNRFHYSSFGGAPLLGIDGICILAHGSSKEVAIFNTIGVATKCARAKLNELITRELETLPQPEEGS